MGQSPMVLALTILFIFASNALAAETREYDLVVVGAGTGGMAAAIQASRAGLSVAIVEESDRVGGQIVGAAVSTMDDVGRTRTGLYMEFIERVSFHYIRTDTATNICLWGADTIAVEPTAAERILLDMLEKTGKDSSVVYTKAKIERLDVSDNKVKGIEIACDAEPNKGKFLLSSNVFIDATEQGDFLARTGARYRVGNSISPEINTEANVQDITYVAVVKKYSGGLPDNLKMPGPPPDYDKYVEKFRSVVTKYGNTWPGDYPFDIPSHNAYRALPDTENKNVIIGDESWTWPSITRTCINWANDYPGQPGEIPGLSVKFIEDMEYRKKIEREAMHKTLCFIWYMQSELGMTDWSVDDGQGYGGFFTNDWETANDPLLPKEFAPILRCFPPFPYIREGRRIVGTDTLRDSDIKRDPFQGRAYKNYSSSLALGEYPVDIHGSHLDMYMEHDLGESTESFPKEWAPSLGVFPVPFEVFIPEKIDGLIAAEKNISVSRMVNGAIRLHPITMHTGQAAGAIAVEAVKKNVRPRDVKILDVQRALMEAGCYITPDVCADTNPSDPWWCGVQWACLYEGMGRISRAQFGVLLPIRTFELEELVKAAGFEGKFELEKHYNNNYISKGDFLREISLALNIAPEQLVDMSEAEFTLNRGDAVTILFRLMFF